MNYYKLLVGDSNNKMDIGTLIDSDITGEMRRLLINAVNMFKISNVVSEGEVYELDKNGIDYQRELQVISRILRYESISWGTIFYLDEMYIKWMTVLKRPF